MGFFLGALSGLFGRCLNAAADIAKIEAAAAYVKCVVKVRGAFVSLLGIACSLLLALAGFLLVHVALFAWLPWSIGVKALVLLVLGLAYVACGLVLVLNINSDRAWMKLAGVDRIMAGLGSRKG